MNLVITIRNAYILNINIYSIILASVMFTDLKNYKDLTKNFGSTKEGVTLLNTVFYHFDEVRKAYSGIERIKVNIFIFIYILC